MKFTYQIYYFFVLFRQVPESKAVFTVVFLEPGKSWVLFSVSQSFFLLHRKSPCFPEIFREFFRPVFQHFSFGHARLTGLCKKTFFQRWAMTYSRNCVRGYSWKCPDEGNFHFGCLFSIIDNNRYNNNNRYNSQFGWVRNFSLGSVRAGQVESKTFIKCL